MTGIRAPPSVAGGRRAERELPALLLPIRVGVAPLSDRVVDLRIGRRRQRMPLVLLGTVLLLAASLVGALLVGALRLDQLRDALPIPGLYTRRGVPSTIRMTGIASRPGIPWLERLLGGAHRRQPRGSGLRRGLASVERHAPPPQPLPSADGVVYMGNQQGRITGVEDRIYACLIEQPLEPGELRIALSKDRPQAIAVGPIGDFDGNFLEPNPEVGGPVFVNVDTGFVETIGGMPSQARRQRAIGRPWCRGAPHVDRGNSWQR